MNIHASRARAVRTAVAFYKTRLKTRKRVPKKIGMRRTERVSFPFFFRFHQFAVLAFDRIPNFMKLLHVYRARNFCRTSISTKKISITQVCEKKIFFFFKWNEMFGIEFIKVKIRNSFITKVYARISFLGIL